jgi:hypothetical protein
MVTSKSVFGSVRILKRIDRAESRIHRVISIQVDHLWTCILSQHCSFSFKSYCSILSSVEVCGDNLCCFHPCCCHQRSTQQSFNLIDFCSTSSSASNLCDVASPSRHPSQTSKSLAYTLPSLPACQTANLSRQSRRKLASTSHPSSILVSASLVPNDLPCPSRHSLPAYFLDLNHQ